MRGPIADATLTSPGTLTSVPMMVKRDLPSERVSPTRAFSETSSDGSTSATRPDCRRDQASAGAVMILP